MENTNFSTNDYNIYNSFTIKDYILLIRTNLRAFIGISSLILILVSLYAVYSNDIYKSTVSIKIIKQNQNILQTSSTYSSVSELDRFVANEIDVLNNFDTRERVAKTLIDSFSNSENKTHFEFLNSEKNTTLSKYDILNGFIKNLENIVSIEQKSGTDIIEISAKSTSPSGAALIANTYADEYRIINLEHNRSELTSIRKFLEKQLADKLAALNETEDTLRIFREKGMIVSINEQSTALINQLSRLEAQRDATQIDLMTSKEILKQFKSVLKDQDPKIVKYLESQSSQTYISALQKEIAELQVNSDLVTGNKSSNLKIIAKMNESEEKIGELTQKLNDKINEIKVGAFATTPENVMVISQNLLEEEIRNHSLEIKLRELQKVIKMHEADFHKLPQKTIKLAQYQRKSEGIKQLYKLLDQKHQEAMIKEFSQPGNISIISRGRVPLKPINLLSSIIISVGFFLGLATAFGFILIKDYFNDKIKSPRDIEKKNITFLTWLPYVKQIEKSNSKIHKSILKDDLDTPMSEAIKFLKSRIKSFDIESKEQLKTILITSATPKEGKTIVSIKLAASFAKSNNRTLLVDCDLRKPRIHSLMKVNKTPGFVDFLFKKVKYEDIIRDSKQNNLFFVTAGLMINNSDIVLDSNAMNNFLTKIRNEFDVIIIDSAPIIPVVDSEILSRKVDGTILVISADRTEENLVDDAIDLIKKQNVNFLGVVLNNFKYKNGYQYYQKYYYNYSSDQKNNRRRKL